MAVPTALPIHIGDIEVPQDDVSGATWRWATRSLPTNLLAHSVRSYCWGVAIARNEGWSFDGFRREGFSENIIEALRSVTKIEGEDYMAFVVGAD